MANKKNPKIKFNKPQSRVTLWIVIIFFLIVFYQLFISGNISRNEVSYSQFMEMINNGQVTSVIIDEKDISFTTNTSSIHYNTYIPFRDPDLIKTLEKHKIKISSRKPSTILSFFLSWLPFIIFLGFWIFMMRSMGGGSSKVFNFSRSRAKLFEKGKSKVTFKDVAGVDEAKEELEEIVTFLKEPKKFQRLGGKIPRGVLLIGRPGTGKTLLAKAVAGEAEVHFYSISGSDFVEMFVGVGASRVRDLFEKAKKTAPCIAFIDEIDAVGRHRGSGLGGGHDEREQTLNQLLVQMDGFEENDAVIIIAASNRPDVLDPALLRPGRFDRQVVVDLPDIKGREEILKVHAKNVEMSKDVSFAVVARSTAGFSGADLANLINESALIAARNNKKKIEMEDMEEAKDKIVLGKEKRSRVINEDEKMVSAYHEIGHVICSIFQKQTEPLHKVTIIPRGFSAGATYFLQTDKSNYSNTYLKEMLTHLLGGRVAEEIVYKNLTTGAGNDIARVTDIAKKMVCSWGMSKIIGPQKIGKEESQIFLGKELTHHQGTSEKLAKTVDTEISKIINNAYLRATEILKEHRALLDILANELFKKETLNVDELFDIISKNSEKKYKAHIKMKYKKALDMKLAISEKKKKKRKK